MAICKECGTTYLTRECLKCKNKKNLKYTTPKKQKLNEKEKLYKTIRYAIIFFIGILILGTISEILVTNYMFKSAEPTINNLNEMTKDMVEANKKLMEELEKGFKKPQFNK
jgi:hypothetical protein